MKNLTDDELWGALRSALASGEWARALRACFLLRTPGAREAALMDWERLSPAPEGTALAWYRLLWGSGWHEAQNDKVAPDLDREALREDLLRTVPNLPDLLKTYPTTVRQGSESGEAMRTRPTGYQKQRGALGRGAPLKLVSFLPETTLSPGGGEPAAEDLPPRPRQVFSLILSGASADGAGKDATRRGEAEFYWRLLPGWAPYLDSSGWQEYRIHREGPWGGVEWKLAARDYPDLPSLSQESARLTDPTLGFRAFQMFSHGYGNTAALRRLILNPSADAPLPEPAPEPAPQHAPEPAAGDVLFQRGSDGEAVPVGLVVNWASHDVVNGRTTLTGRLQTAPPAPANLPTAREYYDRLRAAMTEGSTLSLESAHWNLNTLHNALMRPARIDEELLHRLLPRTFFPSSVAHTMFPVETPPTPDRLIYYQPHDEPVTPRALTPADVIAAFRTLDERSAPLEADLSDPTDPSAED